MARPKSYDREEAVRKARDAFWEHGYDALGISAIEKLTGLGRFAIRTEFGGKEGLFLAALSDYADDTRTYVTDPLREASSLDQVIDILEQTVTPFEGSPRRFGCLMVNTTIENAPVANANLRARTDEHFSKLEDAFRCALKAERDGGRLKDDVSIDDAVQFLSGAIVAATVINRNAGRIDAASGYMRTAIETVKSWRK